MKVTFFEPKNIFKKTVKSWKELYDLLASYGVFKDYNGNNVDEFTYEIFIYKHSSNRSGIYDIPKENRHVIVEYLDVNIQVENLI